MKSKPTRTIRGGEKVSLQQLEVLKGMDHEKKTGIVDLISKKHNRAFNFVKYPLSDRLRNFVINYIAMGSQRDAALAAGYSYSVAVKTAGKLWDRKGVSEYYNWCLNKIYQDSVAEPLEVMKFLTDAMRGNISEEVVVEGQGLEGYKIVNKKIGAKDRMKAAELMARRYRLLDSDVKNNIIPIVFIGESDVAD